MIGSDFGVPFKDEESYLVIIVKGYCTPDQKLACFVLYLKITNTFMKNNICNL